MARAKKHLGYQKGSKAKQERKALLRAKQRRYSLVVEGDSLRKVPAAPLRNAAKKAGLTATFKYDKWGGSTDTTVFLRASNSKSCAQQMKRADKATVLLRQFRLRPRAGFRVMEERKLPSGKWRTVNKGIKKCPR